MKPKETLPSQEPLVEKFNKWLIFIPTAVAVLSLSLSAFLVFQNLQLKKQISSQPTPTPTSTTPDSTAGWKTYQNSKYGFGFKYPSALIPEELSDAIILETSQKLIKVSISIDSFESFYEEMKGRSEEEARRQSSYYLVSEVDYTFGVDQSVQGKKLVVRNFMDSGGIYDESILYFKGKDHSFSVWLEREGEEELVDQILSTFKFLD